MIEPDPLLVPDDFRTFMKHVVAVLEGPADDRFVDAEDALTAQCGYGGRIDHGEAYRFFYITPDGLYKWEIVLHESQIRDVADGLQIEVEGIRHEIARTTSRQRAGKHLLIWGEYADDALRTANSRELIEALDHLHQSSRLHGPRMVRMWSTADDQLIAVINEDWCALYVVESLEGYATSCGDPSRNDSFEVQNYDGRLMPVPWADCIPWGHALNAILHFMRKGDLGPEIRTEGRIPSMLLMMGDVDRQTALAARAEAPREVKRSSLPRMIVPAVPEDTQDDLTSPQDREELDLPELDLEGLAAWAKRLIERLHSRELVELEGPSANVEEITYHVTGLLQAHGTEAQDSIDTANWLANEIGALRGVRRIFATGGDLQIALRRTRTAD